MVAIVVYVIDATTHIRAMWGGAAAHPTPRAWHFAVDRIGWMRVQIWGVTTCNLMTVVVTPYSFEAKIAATRWGAPPRPPHRAAIAAMKSA